MARLPLPRQGEDGGSRRQRAYRDEGAPAPLAGSAFMLRPARASPLLWSSRTRLRGSIPSSALPWFQSSRRDSRTAASARRCTSRAARGRRRPSRYCSSLRHRPDLRAERSSRLGRPRDRNARKPTAGSQPLGRALARRLLCQVPPWRKGGARPSVAVKDAAARLAALGPDGPSLTARRPRTVRRPGGIDRGAGCAGRGSCAGR